MEIDFDFACRDDCLDQMVPSDLRVLVGQRDKALEQVAMLESRLSSATQECEALRLQNAEHCNELFGAGLLITDLRDELDAVKAQVPRWREVTHAEWDIPHFNQPVILCLNGVVQTEVWEIDQADSDYGTAPHFWFRNDCDESPQVKAGDRWMPLPEAPKQPAPAGKEKP